MQPQTYLALLRAVNVGGRTVTMADLRRCLDGLGYGGVRTYIQSGNAVFAAPGPAATVRSEVEAALLASFGIAIPTVVLEAAELDAVVAGNPYPELARTPTRLVVSFLAEPPSDQVRASFSLDDFPEDAVLADRVLYLHYPEGQGRSRLTAAVLARRLGGVWGTARNWRTVLALQTLAGA